MTDRVYLYSWTEGYKPALKAEIAAAEIRRIENERGPVTPSVLLAAARNGQSPFHPLIEWDDEKAAERYRLSQANRIIMSLRVVIKEGEPERPAYASLKDETGDAARAYVSMIDVSSDEVKRREFLLREVQRIGEYLQRSDGFPEMDPVRKALAKVKNTLVRGGESQAQAAD